jgi:xanthine dehydrogenase accessory factor
MNIFERICEVLQSDNEAALATIISASGSTPAPGQSKMLIRTKQDFSTIGTVGGGCLDQYIVLSLNDVKFTGAARVLTYNLNDDESDTGLTCGGTVHVMVESLDVSAERIFRKLLERHKQRLASYLLTGLNGISRKSLLDENGNVLFGNTLSPDILKKIATMVARYSAINGAQRVQQGSEVYILEYIEPPVRVIIFGGGHVGKSASRCGALAGFSITIVDDREPYANRERFPEAEQICCESFDDAIHSLRISRDDYVVIVTRGHRYDEQILEKLLPFEPRYIGMIGSRRKIQLSYERLEARGISHETLAKIHAPIGLEIGAETAEEIGVSIIAELIAVRRGVEFASASS